MAQWRLHLPKPIALPQTSSPPSAEYSLLANRFTELLLEKGVPTHQHVSFVAQHCGLSISQARRKMLGASWSFSEVRQLASELGISLDNLFTNEQSHSDPAIHSEAQKQRTLAIEGTLLIGEVRIACNVTLGTRVMAPNGPADLLAVQLPRELIVGTAAQLAEDLKHGQVFHVHELRIYQPDRAASVVAILDDDPDSSSALCEWFSEAGYEAVAYSSGEQLLGEVEDYDAFIVDFLLAGGESSTETIAEIRLRLPEAPIALLTGKLRDGLVSELDLAPILRTQNVLFFEKPVRPSVLAAALQSGLDRIALQQQSKATGLVP